MNLICNFINKKAIHRNGLDLFHLEDAIEFVKILDKCGYRIYGIDGINIIGKYTQPSMTNSIDLSDFECIKVLQPDFAPNPHETKTIDYNSIALAFLSSRKDNEMYFEIVY